MIFSRKNQVDEITEPSAPAATAPPGHDRLPDWFLRTEEGKRTLVEERERLAAYRKSIIGELESHRSRAKEQAAELLERIDLAAKRSAVAAAEFAKVTSEAAREAAAARGELFRLRCTGERIEGRLNATAPACLDEFRREIQRNLDRFGLGAGRGNEALNRARLLFWRLALIEVASLRLTVASPDECDAAIQSIRAALEDEPRLRGLEITVREMQLLSDRFRSIGMANVVDGAGVAEQYLKVHRRAEAENQRRLVGEV